MPSDVEVRSAVRDWVLTKARNLRPEDLSDRTPLFEVRYLRSIHVPELLQLLERLRGSPIDLAALQPEDLRDIDAIARRFSSNDEPSNNDEPSKERS